MDSVRAAATSVIHSAQRFTSGEELKATTKVGQVMAKAMGSIRFEAKGDNISLGTAKTCANTVWGATLVAGGTLLCVICPPLVLGVAAGSILHACQKHSQKNGVESNKPSLFNEATNSIIKSGLSSLEKKVKFKEEALEKQQAEYSKELKERGAKDPVTESLAQSIESAKVEIKDYKSVINLLKNEKGLSKELERLKEDGKDEIPMLEKITADGLEKNVKVSKELEDKMNNLTNKYGCQEKFQSSIDSCVENMQQLHENSKAKSKNMTLLSLIDTSRIGFKFNSSSALKGVMSESNNATNLPSEFIKKFHDDLPGFLGVSKENFTARGAMDGSISTEQRAKNKAELSKLEIFKGVDPSVVEKHVTKLENDFNELAELRIASAQGKSGTYIDKALKFKTSLDNLREELKTAKHLEEQPKAANALQEANRDEDLSRAMDFLEQEKHI